MLHLTPINILTNYYQQKKDNSDDDTSRFITLDFLEENPDEKELFFDCKNEIEYFYDCISDTDDNKPLFDKKNFADMLPDEPVPLYEDCLRGLRSLLKTLSEMTVEKYIGLFLSNFFISPPAFLLETASSLYTLIRYNQGHGLAFFNTLGLTATLLDNENYIIEFAGYLKDYLDKYLKDSYEIMNFDKNSYYLLPVVIIIADHCFKDKQLPQREYIKIPVYLAHLIKESRKYWLMVQKLGNLRKPDNPVIDEKKAYDIKTEVVSRTYQSWLKPKIESFHSNLTINSDKHRPQIEKIALKNSASTEKMDDDVKIHLAMIKKSMLFNGLSSLFSCETLRTESKTLICDSNFTRSLLHTHCDATNGKVPEFIEHKVSYPERDINNPVSHKVDNYHSVEKSLWDQIKDIFSDDLLAFPAAEASLIPRKSATGVLHGTESETEEPVESVKIVRMLPGNNGIMVPESEITPIINRQSRDDFLFLFYTYISFFSQIKLNREEISLKSQIILDKAYSIYELFCFDGTDKKDFVAKAEEKILAVKAYPHKNVSLSDINNFVNNMEFVFYEKIDKIIDEEVNNNKTGEEKLINLKRRLYETSSYLDGLDKVFIESVISMIPDIPSTKKLIYDNVLSIVKTGLTDENGYNVYKFLNNEKCPIGLNEKLFSFDIKRNNKKLRFEVKNFNSNERYNLMLKYQKPENAEQRKIVNSILEPYIYSRVIRKDVNDNPYTNYVVIHKVLDKNTNKYKNAFNMLHGLVYGREIVIDTPDGNHYSHYEAIGAEGEHYTIIYNGMYWFFESSSSIIIDGITQKNLMSSLPFVNISSLSLSGRIKGGYYINSKNIYFIKINHAFYPVPARIFNRGEDVRPSEGNISPMVRMKKNFWLSQVSKKEILCDLNGMRLSPIAEILQEKSDIDIDIDIDIENCNKKNNLSITAKNSKKTEFSNQEFRSSFLFYTAACYPAMYRNARLHRNLESISEAKPMVSEAEDTLSCSSPDKPLDYLIHKNKTLSASEKLRFLSSFNLLKQDMLANVNVIAHGGCINAFSPENSKKNSVFSINRYNQALVEFFSKRDTYNNITEENLVSSDPYVYNIGITEEYIQRQFSKSIKDDYNLRPLLSVLEKEIPKVEILLKGLMKSFSILDKSYQDHPDEKTAISLETVKCNLLNYSVQLKYLKERLFFYSVNQNIIADVYNDIISNSINFSDNYQIITHSVLSALKMTLNFAISDSPLLNLRHFVFFHRAIFLAEKYDEKLLSLLVTASIYYYLLNKNSEGKDEVIQSRYLELILTDPLYVIFKFLDDYNDLMYPKDPKSLLLDSQIDVQAENSQIKEVLVRKKTIDSKEIKSISRGITGKKISSLNIPSGTFFSFFNAEDNFSIKLGKIENNQFTPTDLSYMDGEKIENYSVIITKVASGEWLLILKSEFFTDLKIIENYALLEDLFYRKKTTITGSDSDIENGFYKISDGGNHGDLVREVLDFYYFILEKLGVVEKSYLINKQEFAIKISGSSSEEMMVIPFFSWLEKNINEQVVRLQSRINILNAYPVVKLNISQHEDFARIHKIIIDRINNIINPKNYGYGVFFDIRNILSSEAFNIKPHGEISVDSYALMLDIIEKILDRLASVTFLVKPEVSAAASAAKKFFTLLRVIHGTHPASKTLRFITGQLVPDDPNNNSLKELITSEISYITPPNLIHKKINIRIPFNSDILFDKYIEVFIEDIRQSIILNKQLSVCLHLSEKPCDNMLKILEDIFDDQYELIIPRVILFWKDKAQVDPVIRYVTTLKLLLPRTIRKGKIRFVIDLPLGDPEYRISQEIVVKTAENWENEYKNKLKNLLIKYKDFYSLEDVEEFLVKIKGNRYNSPVFLPLKTLVADDGLD